jgi:7-cyano-7-deazaguanine synthase
LERIAVLASGGLDSSVLVADLARTREVFPVYVEAGLAWEKMERRALDAYLGALPDANIHKLTVLQLPVRSLYGEHWSTTGENVPDADAPDIDVYLPGRNVLLLGLSGVWCALNDVHEVAIGSLDDNPFPDATPEFFADYSKVLSASLSHRLTISAPYRQRHKAAIIAEFPDLPLELTLTCMSPQLDGSALVHCGACNKCNERQVAFRDAGVEDRTRYAT